MEDLENRSPIEKLPDTILEFILSFLPRYEALEKCLLVNKRWNVCTKNVLHRLDIKLFKSIKEANIKWQNVIPSDTDPCISKRLFYSSCVHKNYLYIFGGCTQSAVYNDLWRLNLSTKQWQNLPATGTIPPPTVYCSLVSYKGFLIFFGGLAIKPGHVNGLYFYEIKSNNWMKVTSYECPYDIYGHVAIIKEDEMMLCGGADNIFYSTSDYYEFTIWALNLNTLFWRKQEIDKCNEPTLKFCHSIIEIDKNHLLVFGGMSKTNLNEFSLLRMIGNIWNWISLDVNNLNWSVDNIWYNPFCKIGDKLVILNFEQNTDRIREYRVTHKLKNDMSGIIDGDEKELHSHRIQNSVNGNNIVSYKVGNHLVKLMSNYNDQSRNHYNYEISNYFSVRNNPDIVVKNYDDRFAMKFMCDVEQQIYESHFSNLTYYAKMLSLQNFHRSFSLNAPLYTGYKLYNKIISVIKSSNPDSEQYFNSIPTFYILDISKVLEEDSRFVSWNQPQAVNVDVSPRDLVLSTFVKGRGEIIMFGGLRYGILTNRMTPDFLNSTYIISPKNTNLDIP